MLTTAIALWTSFISFITLPRRPSNLFHYLSCYLNGLTQTKHKKRSIYKVTSIVWHMHFVRQFCIQQQWYPFECRTSRFKVNQGSWIMINMLHIECSIWYVWNHYYLFYFKSAIAIWPKRWIRLKFSISVRLSNDKDSDIDFNYKMNIT